LARFEAFVSQSSRASTGVSEPGSTR
jgi:hypothetical protein